MRLGQCPGARAAAVLFAVVVGACSGSGGSDSGVERAETSSTTAATTGSSRPSSGAATSAAGSAEGVLRIAFVRPRSIDPGAASPSSIVDLALADLFYDPLTTLGEDGVARPGLATFQADTSRSRWRFQVVDGATFADGSPVTAEDVAFSLDRARSFGAESLPALRLEDVRRVQQVDARTVEVELARPSAVLAEVLSSPLYPVLDKSAIDAAVGGGDQTPNASGDFSVRFTSDTSLELERRRGAGISGVEIQFHDDEAAAFDAFLAGDADWAPVPPDRLGEAVRTAGDEGLIPFHGTLYLAMNLARPELQPLALRQGIAHAIDRKRLVESVFGITAAPLDGVLPLGVPGASAGTCRTRCDYDVDRAAQLVEQALGGAAPTALRLAVEGGGAQETMGGVLAAQLAAVGQPVDVVPFAAGDYEDAVSTGEQQLFVLGWLGVSRTPDSYLTPLFSSTSPDNAVALKDAAVDAALALARVDPFPASRARAWKRAEELVLERAAVVPLVQFRILSAVSPRVVGLRVRVDGTLDLTATRFAG